MPDKLVLVLILSTVVVQVVLFLIGFCRVMWCIFCAITLTMALCRERLSLRNVAFTTHKMWLSVLERAKNQHLYTDRTTPFRERFCRSLQTTLIERSIVSILAIMGIQIIIAAIDTQIWVLLCILFAFIPIGLLFYFGCRKGRLHILNLVE